MPYRLYQKTDYGTHEHAELFMRLRATFEADYCVPNDPITGHILGYSRVAECYDRWMRATLKFSLSESGTATFDLSRFIYDYSIRSQATRIPAYYGGVGGLLAWLAPMATLSLDIDNRSWYTHRRTSKASPDRRPTVGQAPKWATTYWTLFELAQTGRTPSASEALSLVYYADYGILKAGSGGNHRLLAHVLYGHDHISYDRLTSYHCTVPFDEDLNTALLKLESALCRPWWKPTSRPFDLPTLSSYPVSSNQQNTLWCPDSSECVCDCTIFTHTPDYNVDS